MRAAFSPSPEPSRAWLAPIPGWPSVYTVFQAQPELMLDFFASVNGPFYTTVLQKHDPKQFDALGNQTMCADLLLTKPSTRKWACTDSSTLTTVSVSLGA